MHHFSKRLSFILIVIFMLMSVQTFGMDVQEPQADTLDIVKNSVILKVGYPIVYIKNEKVQADTEDIRIRPVVKNGRTLIPVRFAVKAFGADITWNSRTWTATVRNGGKEAQLKPGSNVMVLNGTEVQMDVAPEIISGRMFIPLARLVTDILDKNLLYYKGFIIIGGKEDKMPSTLDKAAFEYVNTLYRDNHVNNYMVYYGTLGKKEIETAKTYPLVIIDLTAKNVTREMVKEIQQGVDPEDPGDDVRVLGYVSMGEDMRTHEKSYEDMLTDPRFTGDGSGPRVDPRGPLPKGGTSLAGINPIGKASPGGTGLASFYLDDNDFDGKPDWNPNFDVAYVNAGDPKWFDVVNNMTIDGADGIPGLKELLTESYGRGLGCDGVFLDTVETCAPNSFTDDGDIDKAKFEWTAPGYCTFIKRLRETYSDKLILQNRAFFFFDPAYPHYQYSTGRYLDYVFFESYRMDSNKNELFNQATFKGNKYDVLPKLMAEAGRYGFQVLSLGYAEGPKNQISPDTLKGKSKLGYQQLMDDINEAENYAGFSHYITNAELTLVNNFVREHSSDVDHDAPVWTSTYCNNFAIWPPEKPTPRIGIQEAVAGRGSVTVRWDVALDKSGVGYTLYYQTKPFDFVGDPYLSDAKSKTISPKGMGKYYEKGTGEGVYPYQETITGLNPGVKYYFVIRAFDKSTAWNEERNRVCIPAVPEN